MSYSNFFQIFCFPKTCEQIYKMENFEEIGPSSSIIHFRWGFLWFLSACDLSFTMVQLKITICSWGSNDTYLRENTKSYIQAFISYAYGCSVTQIQSIEWTMYTHTGPQVTTNLALS